MEYYEDEMNLDEFENYLEKDKSLALKRHYDVTKALRKRAIVKLAYPTIPNWYNNLHQYSKNKIHCSCPLCAAKTNSSLNKSKGPVGRRGTRLACTNQRYGKKNYCMSDKKKVDALNYEE